MKHSPLLNPDVSANAIWGVVCVGVGAHMCERVGSVWDGLSYLCINMKDSPPLNPDVSTNP